MKQIIPGITSLLKRIYPGEIIVCVAMIAVINFYYYLNDPGFFDSRYNPYFILVLFFSSFYGKLSGIFTLIFSILSIAVNSVIIGYYHSWQYLVSFYLVESRINSISQFIFLAFIFSIIIGEIRDSLGTNLQNKDEEIDNLNSRYDKIQHELKAISLVNDEYQDRILGQQNSLISLYSTMISLNSLDMEKIYPSILEAVVKFSGATKCSLWQYLRDDHKLILLSSYGWDESPEKSLNISDDDSITGWVARNNEMFSVKMLQKHESLKLTDTKQNIITVPINIGSQVWGVINIEAMPFVKYNMYSEQLIMMISDLSAPIISNAIRFDEISKKGEIDSITELPSIDEMFSMLKDEFNNAHTNNNKLSFAVVELSNIEELQEKHTNHDVLILLKEITQLTKEFSKGNAVIFQYKEQFQFSIILPNMDYDGAAMFCLSLMEEHGEHQYSIAGDTVEPEIYVGYSSIRPNHKSEEDLMLLAENLLMMQKI